MAPVFRTVFDGAASLWDAEHEQSVLTEPRAVGTLELPTGRLAVHDPGYEFAPDPLDREAPSGRHPVDVALRSWTMPDGTLHAAALIAAARVRLGRRTARRHIRVRGAGGGAELVFGVDSGLISIFDRSLFPQLRSRAILDAVPGSAPEEDREPSAHIVPAPGGGGIFVCQAGMGDGAYRAWWGLDHDDEPVELVVDFALLEYSRWRLVELPADAFLGPPDGLRRALAGTGLDLVRVPSESTGVRIAWTSPDHVAAFRRPPGPLWEFRMIDDAGGVIGSPGLSQLFPGPWFELFELAKLERAATVRVRIHEGTGPYRPIEP